MKKIPKRLVISEGQELSIVERRLNGLATRWDLGGPLIYIESRPPEADKHQVLLHHLVNLAMLKMLQLGIGDGMPGEIYRQKFAETLFLMLTQSGLWDGVSPKEAAEFLRGQVSDA